MARRFDSLPKYTPVRLDFGGHYQEDAVFLYIEGTGDDRTAHFYTRTEKGEGPTQGDKDGYEWAAYRYEGYWAYGSSADRLRLND